VNNRFNCNAKLDLTLSDLDERGHEMASCSLEQVMWKFIKADFKIYIEIGSKQIVHIWVYSNIKKFYLIQSYLVLLSYHKHSSVPMSIQKDTFRNVFVWWNPDK